MKFFIETLGTYSSIVLLTIYDIKKIRFFESSKPISPLNSKAEQVVHRMSGARCKLHLIVLYIQINPLLHVPC